MFRRMCSGLGPGPEGGAGSDGGGLIKVIASPSDFNVRVRRVAPRIAALVAVRLGTLPGVLAGQGPPPVDSLAPTAWLLGLEMSRAPAVFVGWETTQGGWTVGARTGGGSG